MLVGCAAISALPPFNGFVSEWMIFQAVLLSPAFPQWMLKILAPAVGALLALSAALAAACFAKRVRHNLPWPPAQRTRRKHAREADRSSLAAMGVLAALCLLAGIFPGQSIDALSPAVTQSPSAAAHADAGRRSPGCRSRRSPKAAAPTTACSCSCSSRSPPRWPRASSIASPPTRCAARRRGIAAFPTPAPMTQYSAESFAQPIRRVFGSIAFVARERIDMPGPGETRPGAFRSDARRQDLGRTLCAARSRRRARGGASSTACSSSPSASISASSSPRWSRFSSCSRHGPDRRSHLPALADDAGHRGRAAADRHRARDQGAAHCAGGGRRSSSPTAIWSASPARRRSSPTPPRGCSASRPIWCSPRPGSPRLWFRHSRPELLFSWSADLIAIIALLGAARFFLALAGLDVGTSFGGLGSSREALFGALAEPAMIVIVFTLALVAGSTQLSTVAAYMVSS